MYKEVLTSWKGCSCTRSLLDPDSFYVNNRINVRTLLESSHHHPSSHKAKFPESPGGAREEGQVAYDGCRSALKTILPGAGGPGFPTPSLCLDGWISTNREGGTTQVSSLNSTGSLGLLADPPPVCSGHSVSSPTTLTSSLNLLTTRQLRVASTATLKQHAGPGAPDVSPWWTSATPKWRGWTSGVPIQINKSSLQCMLTFWPLAEPTNDSIGQLWSQLQASLW